MGVAGDILGVAVLSLEAPRPYPISNKGYSILVYFTKYVSQRLTIG